MRVPGLSSLLSFGISFWFSDGKQIQRHHGGFADVGRNRSAS
jgi:hypothetical protein